MRQRPFVAAVSAVALVAAGTVATALPAQAAPCVESDACQLEVDLSGPAKIGVAGDWNDYELALHNPTESDVVVDAVAFDLQGSVDTDALGLPPEAGEFPVEILGPWLQMDDGDGWAEVYPDEWAYDDGDGDLTAVLDLGTTVDAGDTVTVDVRFALLGLGSGLFGGLGAPTVRGALPADPTVTDFVDLLNGLSIDLDLTATALGEAQLGLLPTPQPELDSDSVDVVASVLEANAPSKITAELGRPKVVDAGFDNHTGSDYGNAVLFPVVVPGTEGMPIGLVKKLSGSTSPRAALKSLKALTEETSTVIEVKVGDTWYDLYELILGGGENAEAAAALLLDIADGESATNRFRFTFRDPSLKGGSPTPTPSPTSSYEPDLSLPENTVLWLGIRFGDVEMPPQQIVRGLADGFPQLLLAGVDATEVTVVDPVVVTPTPSATTQPAEDVTEKPKKKKDKGLGDEDGAGDDEGEGAGGELAQSGYDLTGQGAAGLFLLVLGALVVAATLRRRVESRG